MAAYFDVSKIGLYRHDLQPTGIERAIFGLCAAGEIHDARPVVFHPGDGRFYKFNHFSDLMSPPAKEPPIRFRSKIYRRLPSFIQRLGDEPRDFMHFKAGRWKRSLAKRLSELERRGTPVDFEPGDTIYILDLNNRIPLYASAMKRLKRVQPNLRIIGFIHDIFPLNYPEWSDKRYVRCFKKWCCFLNATCDGFLTNSREVAGSLPPHIQNKPVRAIMFGSALESLPNEEGVSPPDSLKDPRCADGWILSVGSHMPRKNHIFQLNALEPLWDSGQLRVPLILAGAVTSFTDLIKRRIQASLVLQRHVILLGAVSDEQLWALYRGARLYILSSIYEGFGLTVPEAMQWGCPCFVSRAGAMPEVGGGFVEYFDPRRPEQLRDLAARFFSDPAFEAEMRKRVRDFKPQTWKDAVEDLLAGPDGMPSRESAMAEKN